jgi:outer membrane protein TolC
VKYKSTSLESSASKSAAPSASGFSSVNNNTSGMQSMNAGQAGQTATPATSSMQAGTMSSSSGGSRLVDVYSIQIEAGELENNIQLLKSQQRTSIAEFNSLLNRPLQAAVTVSDSLQVNFPGLDINAVSDSMLANNPMLGMLNYEKQSYEARKKMVSRMGLPMLGLGLNYSLINKSAIPMGDPEMNGKDMLMPMVAVTLPIYRKKYNAMKDESELLGKAIDENLQSVSNSLQVEYLQAVQLYDDSYRRINLYDKQFVLASKTLDLVMKDFSSAAADLTEVLRIRQQTFDYELKQARAVADYYTALAWLRRLGDMELNGNK